MVLRDVCSSVKTPLAPNRRARAPKIVAQMLSVLCFPAFSMTVAMTSAPCSPISVPIWFMISLRAVSAPKIRLAAAMEISSSGPTEKVV